MQFRLGIKECWTEVGLLITRDQTSLASLVGWVVGVSAVDRVVGVTAGSTSDILDKILIGNDDKLSKGADNLLAAVKQKLET